MGSEHVGVRSSVAPLRRVAVRRPTRVGDYEGAHWAGPDLDLLESQHAAFVALLTSLGCQVDVLDPLDGWPDAVFTYDPVFVAGHGAVQLAAAKAARVGEGEALAKDLEAIGVPTIGRLEGLATADGGDMFWWDERTLAVGLTYRTNEAAAQQLRSLLAPQGIDVVTYDVPHDLGPEFCLHLMSVISPVRDDLAVVYPKLAPIRLMKELDRRGIGIVEVPDDEYLTLGCNVLAVEPGVAVLAAGNDVVAERLEAAGVRVHTYEASETNKGEGGPTCLTRPILRVP